MQKNTEYRLCELLDHKIVDASGHPLGHVADIELTRDLQICAFLYGETGWLFRLHVLNPFAKRNKPPARPSKVRWEEVDRIEDGIIHLKPTSPNT